MRMRGAVGLALVCCLFAVQCGRYGPPRRDRPASELQKAIDKANEKKADPTRKPDDK